MLRRSKLMNNLPDSYGIRDTMQKDNINKWSNVSLEISTHLLCLKEKEPDFQPSLSFQLVK